MAKRVKMAKMAKLGKQKIEHRIKEVAATRIQWTLRERISTTNVL